jgi:hypothetical protein
MQADVQVVSGDALDQGRKSGFCPMRCLVILILIADAFFLKRFWTACRTLFECVPFENFLLIWPKLGPALLYGLGRRSRGGLGRRRGEAGRDGV